MHKTNFRNKANIKFSKKVEILQDSRSFGYQNSYNWPNLLSKRSNSQILNVASSSSPSTAQPQSGSAFQKISETLNALNTVGRLLVNITKGHGMALAVENKKSNISDALLTLSNNVLGQKTTKTLEPFIKQVTVTDQTTFKKKDSTTSMPIFLESNEHLSNDITMETKEAENRCTTPNGKLGRCEDLSNCPGLLLDLTHLRESLCFKSLFIPGVCCPFNEITHTLSQRPYQTTTTGPIKSTTRQTLILQTAKPTSLVPEFTMSSTSIINKPQIGGYYVDLEDCGQQEFSSGELR